ncbi:MAG: hypothetical protein E5Y65_08400 [Mesorhizobium sp.]|nr:MAG: hypothetical protein E5Y65_08400 [Mesorhizobium sp.]TIL99643.1 MAG: hypothetical protein E5Y64_20710 [Mesorhizobium sp.]
MPDISPTRGEIGCHRRFRQSPTLKKGALSVKLPISPQVGEMSGRTEGGAKDHYGLYSSPQSAAYFPQW